MLDRRSLLRILRHHRAAAKSTQCPNLFVSRTFSKVYGMAAMRLGCLFSHAANIAVSAQGAIALQREYAGGDGGAGGDRGHRLRRELRGGSAGRARIAVRRPRTTGIDYVPSSANFVLARFGARAIEVRDALRDKAILVRDRSYEAPGGVRITVGTREQTRRLLAELEEIWNR